MPPLVCDEPSAKDSAPTCRASDAFCRPYGLVSSFLNAPFLAVSWCLSPLDDLNAHVAWAPHALDVRVLLADDDEEVSLEVLVAYLLLRAMDDGCDPPSLLLPPLLRSFPPRPLLRGILLLGASMHG